MNSNQLSRRAAASILMILCVLAGASFAISRQDGHKDEADAPRITVAEVLAMLEKHAPVLIVDSRSPGSWEGSDKQIKGSVRIPVDEIEARMNELSKDKDIIIYCS
jgi:3-mercaptopyruvate sulfurtransferase SseA